MRVLHVNNWLPAPPLDGGKMRKLQQLDALRSEHDIVVLGRASATTDAGWLERELPGVRVQEAPTGTDGRADTTTAVRHALARESFDIVHVSGVPQWPALHGPAALPIVLDVDSIESRVLDTLRTAGAAEITPLDLAAVRALERHAFSRAAAVMCCSDADAEIIRALAPSTRVHVAPNAIDVAAFETTPLRAREGPPVLTFTGFLTYRPNADACIWLVQHILPLVRATLGTVRVRVVGRLPPADVAALSLEPDVDVIADVADIRPYLQDADIIVVPLRAGSGTRLKILEAFASGRPVVSTSLGCEGLGVQDGEHLLVADDAATFADAITRLAGDADLAARLAASGRALVETTYDRPVVADTLRDVYRTLGSCRVGTSGRLS